MMYLKLDTKELDRLVDNLDAVEKAAQKALRTTVSKMSTWLRVRAGRAIRQATGLKMSQLRTRLKRLKVKSVQSDGALGGVWIGLNEIDLSRLSPEQDSFGVSAGPSGKSRSYEGAFMGPRPGVIAKKLRGGAFVRKSRARMPITRIGMPIREESERALEGQVFDGFEAQFYKTFEHELKWQTRTQ